MDTKIDEILKNPEILRDLRKESLPNINEEIIFSRKSVQQINGRKLYSNKTQSVKIHKLFDIHDLCFHLALCFANTSLSEKALALYKPEHGIVDTDLTKFYEYSPLEAENCEKIYKTFMYCYIEPDADKRKRIFQEIIQLLRNLIESYHENDCKRTSRINFKYNPILLKIATIYALNIRENIPIVKDSIEINTITKLLTHIFDEEPPYEELFYTNIHKNKKAVKNFIKDSSYYKHAFETILDAFHKKQKDYNAQSDGFANLVEYIMISENASLHYCKERPLTTNEEEYMLYITIACITEYLIQDNDPTKIENMLMFSNFMKKALIPIYGIALEVRTLAKELTATRKAYTELKTNTSAINIEELQNRLIETESNAKTIELENKKLQHENKQLQKDNKILNTKLQTIQANINKNTKSLEDKIKQLESKLNEANETIALYETIESDSKNTKTDILDISALIDNRIGLKKHKN